MKKFHYMSLLAAFVIFCALGVNASNGIYYTNNEGIQMTQVEYHNLLELGFTENQIARMDYATFIDNKDLEGTLVSEVKQYYKTTTVMINGIQYHTSKVISEEEMQKELQTRAGGQPTYGINSASGNYYNGMAYDDYKLLTTRIVNMNEDYMRFKVDIDWLTMPSVRSYDIMGIGFEADKVVRASSIYFREDWRKTNNTFEHTDSCYPKYQNTGAAVMFQLPSASINQLEAYAYFYVMKKSGVNTITLLYASGDYAHATTTVTDDAYNYFSTNYITGLVISSPYHNSYDEISIAQAVFAGTW